MSNLSKSLTTRVFRIGDDLVVLIPKAFELPEGEAVIEQHSGGIFIRSKRVGWKEFFSNPPLSLDLDPAELRSPR